MMLFAPSSARSTLRSSSHTTTSHGSSTKGGRSDTHMRLAAAIAGRQGETRVKTKLFAKTLDPELLRKEAEKVNDMMISFIIFIFFLFWGGFACL